MGLQGYSVPSEKHVIFSVTLGDAFIKSLTELGLHEHIVYLQGCYKGTIEHSYMLPLKVFEFLRFIWPAFCVDQESVLLLDKPVAMNHRRARLWYLNEPSLPGVSKYEELGMFHSVPKEYALTKDAWTRDFKRDIYWVCEHNPAPDAESAKQRQIKQALKAVLDWTDVEEQRVTWQETMAQVRAAYALMEKVK